MSVEKSSHTLWAAIISTFCIVLEYVIYHNRLSGLLANDFATTLGATIGVLLITPHLVVFALACIFTWVGYFTDVRGLTLTGGILNSVALLFALQNWYIVVTPLVFSFLGYSDQKQLRERAEMRQNNPEAYKAFMTDEEAAEKVVSDAHKVGRFGGIGDKLFFIFTTALIVCLVAVLIWLYTGHYFKG